ncbi:MAG TPA: hypothetical protein VE007_14090 [Thermoanaerobaculia bacterium]|nr:hypothetical protein [Thermoanaerobaculia bacterium]
MTTTRTTSAALLFLAGLGFLPARLPADIQRSPTGTNVNSQAATTALITFGNLRSQVPAEALWCGQIIPAAPDIGFKCDPNTIFGVLPIRYDQSRLSPNGSVFTDIMSIPPSVARRAYQAAARGENSAFFYVRRFTSTSGGPDEYVFVTCKLTGGGARVPFALLDVRLAFATDEPVQSVERNAAPPPFKAEISYNGTGQLVGRWEVVLPGDERPAGRDLLTEGTLPPEERLLQRRYTQVERFSVFLPPVGHFTLPGPDPSKLPATVDGLHEILLRIEASDDREADSDLAAAAAGEGIVHAGAVAGFQLPALPYFVGSVPAGVVPGGLALLTPREKTPISTAEPFTFSWSPHPAAALYRLEIADPAQKEIHAALLQPGITSYRAPSFLHDRAPQKFRWRVVATGPDGRVIGSSPWRDAAWAAP